MDFALLMVFAIAGLIFLLSLVPFYDFTSETWYINIHEFWVKYVIQTGMQLSTWLPINAIANIFIIFLNLFALYITFNIARLILNLISGGGTK